MGRQYIGHELLSGGGFKFINKRCDRIKLLMWDVTGIALYQKQLRKESFEVPAKGTNDSAELERFDLVLLLE